MTQVSKLKDLEVENEGLSSDDFNNKGVEEILETKVRSVRGRSDIKFDKDNCSSIKLNKCDSIDILLDEVLDILRLEYFGDSEDYLILGLDNLESFGVVELNDEGDSYSAAEGEIMSEGDIIDSFTGIGFNELQRIAAFGLDMSYGTVGETFTNHNGSRIELPTFLDFVDAEGDDLSETFGCYDESFNNLIMTATDNDLSNTDKVEGFYGGEGKSLTTIDGDYGLIGNLEVGDSEDRIKYEVERAVELEYDIDMDNSFFDSSIDDLGAEQRIYEGILDIASSERLCSDSEESDGVDVGVYDTGGSEAIFYRLDHDENNVEIWDVKSYEDTECLNQFELGDGRIDSDDGNAKNFLDSVIQGDTGPDRRYTGRFILNDLVQGTGTRTGDGSNNIDCNDKLVLQDLVANNNNFETEKGDIGDLFGDCSDYFKSGKEGQNLRAGYEVR